MDWFFKKMGPAAAMSLVAFTGVLNAADDASMRNLENLVTALEQKRGANGMINPPARPVIREGADVWFSGELLIWKPRSDDLNYATELDSGIPTGGATGGDNGLRTGEIQNWKGRWSPAFRLGLGYNTPYDGWDLALMWTRFNSRNKKSEGGNDCDCCPCAPGVFQPEFFPKDYLGPSSNTAPVYVTEAEGKRWKLRLNLLDLELGREFFVSKWMTLRPHVGVRGAWVRQKFKVEYEGGNMFSGAASSFVTDSGTFAAATITEDEITMKNNFWGVGLRAGLDSQWGLGCGFSFYGKLALSAVWGQMKVNQVHTLETTAGTEGQLMNIRNNFRVCRPIADLAAGFRWDTTFSNDSWGMGIWAGWEHHYFWGQNKLFKYTGANYNVVDQNDGDLSLAGVNIGMSFDF